MKKLILLIFLSIILSALSAQVLMPKVITNNMVLQREKPVAIWGTAAPDDGAPAADRAGVAASERCQDPRAGGRPHHQRG